MTLVRVRDIKENPCTPSYKRSVSKLVLEFLGGLNSRPFRRQYPYLSLQVSCSSASLSFSRQVSIHGLCLYAYSIYRRIPTDLAMLFRSRATNYSCSEKSPINTIKAHMATYSVLYQTYDTALLELGTRYWYYVSATLPCPLPGSTLLEKRGVDLFSSFQFQLNCKLYGRCPRFIS